MAMTQTEYLVHSLLIPLYQETLVLPCAAVAEIVPYSQPQAVQGAPSWLLGTIDWRGQTTPLVSLEAVYGMPLPVHPPPEYIAVMNRQVAYPDLQFYAVAITGIPRMVRIDAKTITVQERCSERPRVLSCVLVKGEPAMIPDLGTVENLLRTFAIH